MVKEFCMLFPQRTSADSLELYTKKNHKYPDFKKCLGNAVRHNRVGCFGLSCAGPWPQLLLHPYSCDRQAEGSDFECFLVMLFSPADAAEILGQDPMLLTRLVQWCSVSDPSGICREANRLLASILHHNRSQVQQLLLGDSCFPLPRDF